MKSHGFWLKYQPFVALWLMAICSLLNYSLFSQTITIQPGWHHLGTAKLGGIGLQLGFSKDLSDKWNIGLAGHIVHATGARNFSYSAGERYTLGDPQKPERFYDHLSIPSGLLDEEDYLVTYGLRPDRTTQISYCLSLGYEIRTGGGAFEIQFRPGLSSIHKKYIIDADKGDFTNLLGTFEDIHLVYVYVNDYVDISFMTQVTYSLASGKRFRPGLSVHIEYLFSGYWNYGIGLSMKFGSE